MNKIGRKQSLETRKKISDKMKGRKLSIESRRKISASASTRLNKEVRLKISNSLKDYFAKNKIIRKPRTVTYSDKFRKDSSLRAKKNNLGGYHPNSIKKHKSGTYKGFRCDSSWELAYVIFNLENDILFKRNTNKFEYIFQGKIKKWIPDFILNDGTFVEIKGYLGEEAKAKISNFKFPLIVLHNKEIQPYLDYVIKKYGKDFIKLYVK